MRHAGDGGRAGGDLRGKCRPCRGVWAEQAEWGSPAPAAAGDPVLRGPTRGGRGLRGETRGWWGLPGRGGWDGSREGLVRRGACPVPQMGGASINRACLSGRGVACPVDGRGFVNRGGPVRRGAWSEQGGAVPEREERGRGSQYGAGGAWSVGRWAWPVRRGAWLKQGGKGPEGSGWGRGFFGEGRDLPGRGGACQERVGHVRRGRGLSGKGDSWLGVGRVRGEAWPELGIEGPPKAFGAGFARRWAGPVREGAGVPLVWGGAFPEMGRDLSGRGVA